jgi:hypothetical protein
MNSMKQQPTVTDMPKRLPGEDDNAYMKRCLAFLNGDDIRTKTDLKDWTGCPPMHLDVYK